MSAEVDTAVIGAGALGLACASELARAGRSVVVLERHDGPGRETTSRNSGVVHAGLYYPTGSLKALSCVEGRELLYARCARDAVPHAKVGKLIVATEDAEVPRLEALLTKGRDNGVEGLSLIDGAEARRLEPHVRAVAALRSTESGVVDAHELLRSYAAEAEAYGAHVVYRAAVEGAERSPTGWSLSVREADGERTRLDTAHVINAAGLHTDTVAALFGVDVDARGWRLRWCKGDYFTLASRWRGRFRGLVYPLPVHAGLGVHLTVDLGGAVRAGPDTTYVHTLDYDVDADRAGAFAEAARRYLPALEDHDLAPDYAGIRPKLYGPDEPARDFVLETVDDVTHLVGIESPGLTASEALARRVSASLGA